MLLWGISRSSSTPLQVFSCIMECNFQGIWDSMGNAKDNLLSPLCLEKLVWKAPVNHMENGPQHV